MAKMFYSLDEAMAKLGCKEDRIRQAVRDGKLREFRDAGKVNFKSDEIEMLAAEIAGDAGANEQSPLSDADMELSASLGPISLADTDDNPMPDLSSSGSLGSLNLADTGVDVGGSTGGATTPGGSTPGGSTPGGSTTGLTSSIGGTTFDLADASGIDLASTGEDMVSLDEDLSSASDDATSAGTKKDDTVVSSVGISVFDEDDIAEESADPMAKTVMSGTSSGTGLEGVGSGSGLLELTRESDDTSLGAELLDEIYPGDEGTVEMGEATRAGLEGALPDDTPAPAPSVDSDVYDSVEDDSPTSPTAAKPRARVAAISTSDAFSGGATALVTVSIVMMLISGLAMASMIRGVWPPILGFVYNKLWMFGLGAVVIGGIATAVSVVLAKRSAA
jgi:hypothetical protein